MNWFIIKKKKKKKHSGIKLRIRIPSSAIWDRPTAMLYYVLFFPSQCKRRKGLAMRDSMIAIASLEAKRKGAQPPFYATTTTKSPVGYAFSGAGSDE